MATINNTAAVLPSSTVYPAAGERFAKVTEALQTAVTDGAIPGGVLAIVHQGQTVYQFAAGQKWDEPPSGMRNEVLRDTVYDLGTLTLSVVTTTLLTQLVDSGQVRLDEKLARYLQPFGVHGKSTVTINQLLNHSSGLAAQAPYFEELSSANSGARIGILTSRGAREYVITSLNRSELKYPPGSKHLFSPLNFILLGALTEALTGLPIDKAAQRRIFQPLGLKGTSFVDLAMIKRRGIHPVRDKIAPTVGCDWRRRVMCGEVHDQNAWAMGGISGHAGLFSQAHDMALFCAEMQRCWAGKGSLVSRKTLELFWQPSSQAETGYRYGWEAPSKENTMIDSELSERAVGMNSETGCSMWFEPDRHLAVVLLTNRVESTRGGKIARPARIAIMNAALEACPQ